jgi:hypothetical protein
MSPEAPLRLDLEARMEGTELVLASSEGFERRVPEPPDWWPNTWTDWILAYVENDGLELDATLSGQLVALLDGIQHPEVAPIALDLRDVYGVGDEALAKLFFQIDSYLALDDVDSMLAVMACAVSVADADGEPLWLLLVGPASGSKTETIRATKRIADAQLSDITLAGLLSGRPPKGDDPSPSRSGLLSELGDDCNAFVTISDLSSLLGRNSGGSGQPGTGVFEALRDVYDGTYTRTMDRCSPQWTGRITFVAAVTPAIDSYSGYADALGPRWAYFRLRQLSDERRKLVSRLVSERKDVELHRAAVQHAVRDIVVEARQRVASTDVPEAVRDAIESSAMLASYGRAAVPRDYQGRVVDVAYWEEPGRLVQQLTKLARGLIALGVGEDVAVRIARRAAMSCIPAARAQVLDAVTDGGWHTTNAIAKAVGQKHLVVQRALEAWEASGTVEMRVRDLSGVPGTEDNEDIGRDTRPREWRLSDDRRWLLAL